MFHTPAHKAPASAPAAQFVPRANDDEIVAAAAVIYGNDPTNSVEFEAARETLRVASAAGYRFTTFGAIIRPA